ncbi:MAG TPA: DUF1810 domain-containing protein [Steroidobacteraceae bacterium]|nr:DUF1810 domain-containing protein [Steroidobacteraceae bacterium]
MTTTSDRFNLQRFVTAQEPVFDRVCEELREGEKTTHWMWFVFPQIRGLGSSPMAQKYAISSAEEALAYLEHPVLGPRLLECTRFVNSVQGRSLHQIFGSPDDMKFRSCMTLFSQVAPDIDEFSDALRKYCGGMPDPRTLEKLQ